MAISIVLTAFYSDQNVGIIEVKPLSPMLPLPHYWTIKNLINKNNVLAK